jgi:hypothetical protein
MSDTNNQNNLPKLINIQNAQTKEGQTDKFTYISRKRKRASVNRLGGKILSKKVEKDTRLLIDDDLSEENDDYFNIHFNPDKPTRETTFKPIEGKYNFNRLYFYLKPNRINNYLVDMDDLKNAKKQIEGFKAYYGKRGSSNEYINRALDGLKSEDEMIVLNCLCELSSELSMANDNLAEDTNCQALIKELIILFDKFYMLPDIGSN